MVARPADAGAGLFKLVTPDDGLTQWSARRMVGQMANDVRRAGPASACRRKPHWQTLPPRGPIISTTVNSRGCTLFSWALCLAGRYGRCARAAILPVAGCRCPGESKLAQADKHTNAGMLRERFNYYCEKVVKGSIRIIFCALTARLCWLIACNLSTVGHRHLMICVWH